MAYDDEKYARYQEWINSLPRPQVLAAEGVDTPVAIEDVEANVPVSQGFMHVSPQLASPQFDYEGMTPIGRTPEDDALLTQRNIIVGDREAGITPRMRQDATRAQGMLEYESLIQGGATPQEAYLRVAPKINPRGFARDIQQATPFQPSVTEVDGVKFAITGRNSARPLPAPADLLKKAELEMANQDAKAAQVQIVRRTSAPAGTYFDNEKVLPGLTNALTSARGQVMALSGDAPTAKAVEVEKTLKNGRKAIFNSKTRDFIRYVE